MCTNQFVVTLKIQTQTHLTICSSLDAVVHHNDRPVIDWTILLLELATILTLERDDNYTLGRGLESYPDLHPSHESQCGQ